MLILHEHRGTNCAILTGTRDHQALGAWEKLSFALGATRSNYPDGVQWSLQPRHRQLSWAFSSYRLTLAGTFFVPSMC